MKRAPKPLLRRLVHNLLLPHERAHSKMGRRMLSESKWDIHYLLTPPILAPSPSTTALSTLTNLNSLTTCSALRKYWPYFENDEPGSQQARRSSNQFKKWLLVGKQRDLESWEMFPSTVNAYFNPPSNEVSKEAMFSKLLRTESLQIVFPAGILQPPFFQANWCVHFTSTLFIESKC